MLTLSSRRLWLASIPVALVLGATVVRAQSAATATPVAGVLRAAPAPADRIHLTTDQVRLLLAAHHPAIVDGISDDNSITIILASNGAYLASSSAKTAVPSAAVARGGGGGAVIAAAGGGGGGGGAGGFSARGASGGSGGAGGVGGAVASTAPRAAGEPRAPAQMTFPGIGTLDADVVHDMFFTSYEAGELVANPVRVRFVVLVPNAVIK